MVRVAQVSDDGPRKMRGGVRVKGTEVGGDLRHGSRADCGDGGVVTAAEHVKLGVGLLAEWTG